MDPGIAARLDHAELGYPCPALWISRAEVAVTDGDLDVHGFRPMRDVPTGEAFPVGNGLAVDLRFDRRIALLSTAEPYETLFECEFADSHLQRWADAGHAEGQMLVFVGPDRFIRDEGTTHWLGDALVAVVPLAVFMFGWGVGTRAGSAAPQP